jgi:hypothetical protein
MGGRGLGFSQVPDTYLTQFREHCRQEVHHSQGGRAPIRSRKEGTDRTSSPGRKAQTTRGGWIAEVRGSQKAHLFQGGALELLLAQQGQRCSRAEPRYEGVALTLRCRSWSPEEWEGRTTTTIKHQTPEHTIIISQPETILKMTDQDSPTHPPKNLDDQSAGGRRELRAEGGAQLSLQTQSGRGRRERRI